ncbi:MAG TPA: glycosyltransferase, partial [Caulobacteraceae bacterium]|nr:glycosyltransferase [Caulobacteraceae bacterium]
RFVCLTDDATGLRAEVIGAAIPAMPRFDQPKERGWLKIASFSPELTSLLDETVLFLDLDVVVVDSLDPLFDHPGAFPMIRDWYHPMRLVGNSSVYRYRPAERCDIFETFARDPDGIVRRIRNEQEYLSEYLQARGELSFWPAAWCPSYRVGCLPPWPLRLWQAPRAPAGARVIVFHGEPKPAGAIEGRFSLGLQSYRPAPWIAQHWRE